MKKINIGGLGLCLFLFLFAPPKATAGPFQATGFKVGEASDTTAIVWTRLTQKEKPNPKSGPMFEVIYENRKKGMRSKVTGLKFPEGAKVDNIRFGVPGTEGETRVLYQLAGKGDRNWKETKWQAVEPEWDFTRQFILTGLQPDSRYAVRVESRGTDGGDGQALEGGFRTAPKQGDSAKVVFTVSTGQMFDDRDSDDGFLLYDAIYKLDPSFFVHTGDIIYYDRLAKTTALANWHWQRTYGLASNVRFHNRVGSYFIKDDHDAWTNDCWPTMDAPAMYQFTFAQGLAIFPHQVPMGNKTYRTRRWGKDLQIWMVEGRDFRSSNRMEDGPDKTIWGTEQKAWFKKTVEESNAAFRILISPTPVVGPDRDTKADNHSNSVFTHEGNEVREFMSRQKNMIVICGDRHWQYHSIDPKTGVNEFSCGPASDSHAGGWKQSDYRKTHHRFLKVMGGFLSVTVDREDSKPVMTCRFHAVDGTVRYEKRFEAK